MRLLKNLLQQEFDNQVRQQHCMYDDVQLKNNSVYNCLGQTEV